MMAWVLQQDHGISYLTARVWRHISDIRGSASPGYSALQKRIIWGIVV